MNTRLPPSADSSAPALQHIPVLANRRGSRGSKTTGSARRDSGGGEWTAEDKERMMASDFGFDSGLGCDSGRARRERRDSGSWLVAGRFSTTPRGGEKDRDRVSGVRHVAPHRSGPAPDFDPSRSLDEFLRLEESSRVQQPGSLRGSPDSPQQSALPAMRQAAATLPSQSMAEFQALEEGLGLAHPQQQAAYSSPHTGPVHALI